MLVVPECDELQYLGVIIKIWSMSWVHLSENGIQVRNYSNSGGDVEVQKIKLAQLIAKGHSVLSGRLKSVSVTPYCLADVLAIGIKSCFDKGSNYLFPLMP